MLAIRRVSVFLPEEQSGTGANAPAFDIANGSMSWSDTVDATGWRLSTTRSITLPDWQEVTEPLIFTNGMVFCGNAFTNSAGFYRMAHPALK